MSQVWRTSDDSDGVPFDDNSRSPAHVIARALAEYDGWGEIRPGHRYQANAVVRALKAKGLLVDARKAPRWPPRQPPTSSSFNPSPRSTE